MVLVFAANSIRLTTVSAAGGLVIVTVLSVSVLVYCVPSRRLSSAISVSESPGSLEKATEGVVPRFLSIVEDNIAAAGGLHLAQPVLYGTDLYRRSVSDTRDALLPGQCHQGRCQNGTSKPEDFVFAIATHRANEPALIAGRSGRLGMRTYVSTNYTQEDGAQYPSVESETWAFYPDDTHLRSFYVGDTRAALVPFLAYRDLGDTFKWVFYGDDDTLFFVDAAMDLVKDLDPDMPYFLTDHFWYANWNYGYAWHPHWRAPRCLPCYSDLDTARLRMGMVKACPCTPQAMCGLDNGYDRVLDPKICSAPKAPTLTYSMHGGAGALISIGLLKRVSLQQMEKCAQQEWLSGGDSFITTCLWQAGYGMTDPGPVWHPDGLTRFDPTPRKLIYDTPAYTIRRVAFTIGNLIADAAGLCRGRCQIEKGHIISLHFRSRLLTNTSRGAGALLRGAMRFYNLQTGRLEEARKRQIGIADTEDAGAETLASFIDEKFAQGVAKLNLLMPSLKAISEKQTRWPYEGVAALFMPSKPLIRTEDGKEEIELSLDDLVKGWATGIAQSILEEALERVLELYPPPPVW